MTKTNGYICHTCGKHHDEAPMCYGAAAPAAWHGIPEHEREQRGVLSSDQCMIDEKYFFVLGRILIPVTGSDEPFVWLAWVSLSEQNFSRMSALWESEGRETEPPCFGWLQSALPGYASSTLNLKTQVHTMPLGERPLIVVEATDHPLSLEQQFGISRARIQEIAETVLHA